MYCQDVPEGAIVNVRAVPRSSRAGLDGVLGDAVKVRLRSAPVDGKANRELCVFLAKKLKLPKSAVSLVSGQTSRDKVVFLPGVTAAALAAALE